MIRAGLILTAGILLAGCQIYPDSPQPRTAREVTDQVGAYNDAASLCGPGQVEQRPGTDGTHRSDYVCRNTR